MSPWPTSSAADWQPAALDLSLDTRVTCFAVAVSLLTGALFGMAPAWQSSKPELTSMLKDRSGSQFQTLRFQNPLIVGQVALSLVALIFAGLFVRTLKRLKRFSPL